MTHLETPPSAQEQNQIATLTLARTKNIGPVTFKNLIRFYGSAEAALAALPELHVKGSNGKKLTIASKDAVLKEIEATYNFGAELLTYFSSNYPKALKNIFDAPPVLTLKGNLSLLERPCFAIVGSRNASLNNQTFAAQLSQRLGEQGISIVSGLALGIDTAAHKSALATGTIGVMAGGIDQIYPSENSKLFHEMYEKGLVISEAPFGTMPHATLFPKRNRIISGISFAVAIIEAAEKSGSLITAAYATEQGRTLYAVPGSPLDLRSRGCNKLIVEGAKLLQHVDDILKEPQTLGEKYHSFAFDAQLRIPNEQELTRHRSRVFSLLSMSPCALELIAIEADIPIDILNFLILELEIAGKVVRTFGNKIALYYC